MGAFFCGNKARKSYRHGSGIGCRVNWTHDGGRQDGWFRKEMIYYAKLVE